MWDNPYYFFRIPHTDRVGNKSFKEIIVNVIQSARYRDPKKDMRSVGLKVKNVLIAFKIITLLKVFRPAHLLIL